MAQAQRDRHPLGPTSAHRTATPASYFLCGVDISSSLAKSPPNSGSVVLRDSIGHPVIHYKHGVDTIRLASRRRKLSIDYDYYTRDADGAPKDKSSSVYRAARLCGYKIRRQFLAHYFQSPPRWRTLLRQISKQRILPDFGVIGTVKSGTTDLAATLLSHPNVLCPLVKEFDSTDPADWKKFYPTTTAVQRHSKHYGACLSPFVSPYLHALDIASSLSYLKQGTKIIINLRNPSELVFSEWKWTILHTKPDVWVRTPYLHTFPAFVEKAIELFPGMHSPVWATLHNGIYWHSVAHWLTCFGEDNVRIFDISEYFTDRSSYLERVLQFLGLPNVVLPEDCPIANSNPLRLPAPTVETKAKLQDFFDSHNQRLWRILGRTYAW